MGICVEGTGHGMIVVHAYIKHFKELKEDKHVHTHIMGVGIVCGFQGGWAQQWQVQVRMNG